MLKRTNPKISIIWALLILSQGCSDQAAKVALDAADRQAQQNTAMAELNKEVAIGTHQLVEADAQARKDMVTVHHDLQQERSRLDAGWSELNGERHTIAGERKTESLFVSAATLAGSVLLVVLLLGFCRHILAAAQQDGASTAELQELLVNEVLSNSVSPPLLHGFPLKPHRQLPETSPPLFKTDSV